MFGQETLLVGKGRFLQNHVPMTLGYLDLLALKREGRSGLRKDCFHHHSPNPASVPTNRH